MRRQLLRGVLFPLLILAVISTTAATLLAKQYADNWYDVFLLNSAGAKAGGGLGLAIVAEIAEANNAKVFVADRKGGTIVRVQLEPSAA